MNALQIRNPIYNSSGGIDCEFNHDALGWISFSSSPEDVEKHGRDIYYRALEMGPLPYVEPTPPTPSLNDYRAAIQAMIDNKASERQYDSGATLASYVNSTIEQWAIEAQSFVAWRDAVWLYALVELEKVQKGVRDQPSVEDFLAELPVFEWPEA